MSISTPGGDPRRPIVVTGKKAVAGGKPATDDDPATDESASTDPVEESAADSPAADGSAASAGADKATAAGRTTAAGKTAAATRTADRKTAPGARSGSGDKATAGRTGPGAKRPAGGTRPGAGGKGRKRVAPVKVTQGRSWGPIALFTAAGVLAAAIIAFGAYSVYENGKSWQEKADDIPGIADIRKTDPDSLKYEKHQAGPIKYTKYIPPVGGVHNDVWQNCMGDVYDAPIANEHAVHSLEHGAVWVTYRPDLPKDQVEKLAAKVRGKTQMLMSPYEGLDKPISLQAWGYQLKVNNADDGRIDDFIKALRVNAAAEPGASCSQGITATGTTPHDLPGGGDANAGGMGQGGQPDPGQGQPQPPQ